MLLHGRQDELSVLDRDLIALDDEDNARQNGAALRSGRFDERSD